ncbi:hypothetical protein GOV07_01885 [Candidatus Woesearchaeota archaeon]|nr:hypothetical protein [Candidatus Woesearchaeota archaeon]
MRPLITIEGHQAAGKSTLGEALGIRIGAQYQETRSLVDHVGSGAMSRYQAFMDANLRFSDSFEGNVWATVVNGYWPTTKASHEHLLGLLHGGLELPEGASERLYVPSAAILMAASSSVVVERLEKRGEEIKGHNRPIHMIKTLMGIRHYYDNLAVPYTIIDTSILDKEQTLVAALEFIADYSVMDRSPVKLSSVNAGKRWDLHEASPEMTPEAQRHMKAVIAAERRRAGARSRT